MEENKFFRLIWRFNALVVVCSRLLAIAILLFAIVQIARESSRERQGNSSIEAKDNSQIKEIYQIENFKEVTGTPYLTFPLSLERTEPNNYYSSKATNFYHNYLFFNSATNTKKWLLSDNNSSIISDRFIIETEAENSFVRAILDNIVTKDTDRD